MKLIAEIKTKVIKVIKCLTAVFIIATVLSGCSVLSNYNETNFDGYTISLVQASIDGDLNEVKLLVGEGADLEIRNNEGWTPLMVAAYYGYIDIAKFLVGSGAKVDVQNNKKFTALMHSASKGHYAMSKYLVDSGSNVNTVNDRNEGALVWAVKSGNFDIVKLLVESGADINALEIDRYSPLWCSIEHGAEMFGYLLDNGAEIQPLVVAEAIESGNKKIVGLILNKGVSEDVQYMNGRPWDNFLAWSPLMFATCYGDIGMVEYIMDRGHGLNKPNAFGQLPIHSAAAWCSKDKLVNIDMIKFLMSKNIDIDKKTTKGISKGTEGVNPLAIAACAGKYRKEFVNFLLEFDVDVNAKGLFMDRYKFAPKCVAKAGDLDTFKKLVLKGADVNSNYGDIMTMAVYSKNKDLVKYIESLSHNLNVSGENTNEGLFAAVVKGDAGMTTFFIKKGADVNAKHGEPGSPRNTVLIEAVNGGSIEVVELLLDSGADINLLNRYHDTSLNAAAIKGDLDLFNYLILKGASFKNSDRQEKKILHNAASGGNLDIVKYLIKQGLSVDSIDGNNSTPLMHSAARGKLDVTRFLLAEGADVNYVDSFSSSVLSKAIIKKKNTDKELLVLLLENGADVDKMLNYHQGEAKMTAVQFAKKYLNKELYRLIKSKSSFLKRMLNLWSP